MPKKGEKKVLAWIASFFTIVGFLIAILISREDKYVMFYAKQGLIIFIGFVIAEILMEIKIIGWLFYIFIIILWVASWINALSGKKINTFIIGDIAEKIKL